MDPYIIQLLQGFFDGVLSPAETETLARWVDGSSEEELEQLISKSWETFVPGKSLPEAKANELLTSILTRAKAAEVRPARVISMRRWKTIAAAVACILMVSGIAGYLWYHHQIKNLVTATHFTKDIPAPVSSKAMITLSNGKQVALDSAAKGTIAIQGTATLVKKENGQIEYKAPAENAALAYNTLSNPRGSPVISLTLSDGSQIWLNAGSSLTYPVAFGQGERKVTVNGEAYFEVTHDASRPFIVSKNDLAVKVLGTHFNVNAYDDDRDTKVTLLEGSVNVQNQKSSLTIKPGQQAQVNQTVQLVPAVDLDQVMAWKNGNFYFSHTELESVMREISRWYDVDVSYEGTIPKMYFGGEVSRNNNVSEVLKILEASNVHFRIEGKKIIVMQ